MTVENKDEHKNEGEVEEVFNYGDSRIASAHHPIPLWLILTYITLPLWGIVWFYFFWNGSYGWLDPGYWSELQRAANTTLPIQNVNIVTERI